MTEEEPVESEVVVREERCKVTVVKHRGTWNATGMCRGKLLEVHRAGTPAQAFEWWKNKAAMAQPG